MENILPQSNSYLMGHDSAVNMFLSAFKTGTIHNSWLILGPQGIGKATFAFKIARFLLSADINKKEEYNSINITENHPVFKLVSSNSHPDLKIIERDFIETDKKKVIKAIKDGEALDETELQNLKKSSVIKVDDIRTVNEFLSKKSFDGNWRIVIIDSADDMNSNAANALLKVLEEPPYKSILLLISHNPNKLLPTIKSRCAKINLSPLNDDDVASLLRRYRSNLSEVQIKELAKICSGSIGKAINYADNDGLILYNSLQNLFFARTEFDIGKALELALSVSKDEQMWDLCQELIEKFVSDMFLSGEKIEELGVAWDKVKNIFHETVSLNMDKRHAFITIINTICKAL